MHGELLLLMSFLFQQGHTEIIWTSQWQDSDLRDRVWDQNGTSYFRPHWYFDFSSASTKWFNATYTLNTVCGLSLYVMDFGYVKFSLHDLSYHAQDPGTSTLPYVGSK